MGGGVVGGKREGVVMAQKGTGGWSESETGLIIILPEHDTLRSLSSTYRLVLVATAAALSACISLLDSTLLLYVLAVVVDNPCHQSALPALSNLPSSFLTHNISST